MRKIITILLTPAMLFSQVVARSPEKIDVTDELKKIMAAETGRAVFIKYKVTRYDKSKKRKKITLTAEMRSEAGGSSRSIKYSNAGGFLFELESSDYGGKVIRIGADGKITDASASLTEYPAGFPLTYEDLFRIDYAGQYSGAYLFNEKSSGTECRVFSLRPASRASGYSRLVIWAGIKDHLIRRIDFYRADQSTRSKTMSAVAIKDDPLNGLYRMKEKWVDLEENDKAEIEVTDYTTISAPAADDK